MAKTTQQFDLSQFSLQPDGSYKKNSTSVQPRDVIKSTAINICKPSKINDSWIGSPVPNFDLFGKAPLPKDFVKEVKILRKITLNLFGEPMPKQSVRSFISGGKIAHFQPKKLGDRTKDYIRQIKEQLPKDFTPFMTEVYVTKFHCIYPPLKGFHKIKGRMDAIRDGQIFYKNTQPDLIDNLKKLVFDCLGKDKKTKIPLVLGNDGIIVGEDNTRKYYGSGGCIIIELEGY